MRRHYIPVYKFFVNELLIGASGSEAWVQKDAYVKPCERRNSGPRAEAELTRNCWIETEHVSGALAFISLTKETIEVAQD